MAAHRATRPEKDPFTIAQLEIERRLSNGDEEAWEWLADFLKPSEIDWLIGQKIKSEGKHSETASWLAERMNSHPPIDAI